MNRRSMLKMLTGGLLLPGVAGLPAWANNTGRRLILLELAGANDGLNTVVPWRNDHYYKLRPGLALADRERISLNDEFAVHSALEPLLSLWEAGDLAIVHGLGYPKPNRSHFKSIALWETGGDGTRAGRQGWPTHDLEHHCASRQVDACGVSLGGGMGVFSNATGNWLSMRSVGQFATASLSIDEAATQSENPLMRLLDHRARSLERSISSIAAKIEANPGVSNQSGSKLARQVSQAVGLINAGVDAPVLKLSLKGFDTHENQRARHQRLLSELGRSIKKLRQQLVLSGEWDNTLVITYSEFGRTPAENSNGGTDHGTVAPHFVMGGNINGGFYGQAPEIPAEDNADMAYTMDYRALYSAVLQHWLQTDSDQFAQWRDQRLDSLV
jgi:uncharacterized protein (DUF1501 family)